MPAVDPELALEHGLFSRRQAREAGNDERTIARRIRHGEWVVVRRGVLRVAARADQAGDALLGAALRAGPQAVASHLSAAAVLGWDLLDHPKRPQVSVPREQSRTTVPGAALFRRKLSEDEICLVGVLRTTSPLRTALDLAIDIPRVDAVVAIDSALRQNQVSLDGLHRGLDQRRNVPSHPSAAAVLDQVDPLAGSVWESVARLLFHDNGVPRPICQFEVCVDGVRLARVDFAWPHAKLVVEIDGFAWHSGQSALSRDRARQNKLELASWTVLRYSANDVRDDSARILADVRAALCTA
jgi:hypothetical protein